MMGNGDILPTVGKALAARFLGETPVELTSEIAGCQMSSRGESGYVARLGVTKVAKNSKQTSSKAATAASKVLRDGRTSAASKTAAASALSQKGKGKK